MAKTPNERLSVLATQKSQMLGTEIEAALEAPRWTEATKVHDWRNHVPPGIQDV
jgi:hypothetical protein